MPGSLVDLLLRTVRNREPPDYEYNSDIGEWVKSESPGSGLTTVEATVSGNTTTTLATITANYKGVATYLKINYGGNNDAAPNADFTLLENTSTTRINIPQEAAVMLNGSQGVDIEAIGSLKAPVLELAAGAIVIKTAHANDHARVTLTYKEELVTPN